MHEAGGVERLSRLFARHSVGRQSAQFVVDQREKLAGRVRITAGYGVQYPTDRLHKL